MSLPFVIIERAIWPSLKSWTTPWPGPMQVPLPKQTTPSPFPLLAPAREARSPKSPTRVAQVKREGSVLGFVLPRFIDLFIFKSLMVRFSLYCLGFVRFPFTFQNKNALGFLFLLEIQYILSHCGRLFSTKKQSSTNVSCRVTHPFALPCNNTASVSPSVTIPHPLLRASVAQDFSAGATRSIAIAH